MERIVIKHLSGSKANQVEEFPLNHFTELSLGRDPAASVKYDPDRDDLVGRVHARIVRDVGDPTQFIIEDLKSRNGTYVNRRRLAGPARIAPGDIVQFGPGGPEFQFEVEPRPDRFMRSTLEMTGPYDTNQNSRVVKPTREAASYPQSNNTLPVPPLGVSGANPSDSDFFNLLNRVAGQAEPMPQRQSVGKETVERLIVQSTKKQSRRNFIAFGAMLMAVITAAAGVIGYLLWQSKPLPSVLTQTTLSPAGIAETQGKTVVYIEVSWKLEYTKTGGMIYHMHLPNAYKDKTGTQRLFVNNGSPYVAAYIKLENKLEPRLATNGQAEHVIGKEGSGSGFIVSTDGFILTNKHVAAGWESVYEFPDEDTRGVLVNSSGKPLFDTDGRPEIVAAPDEWVPAESGQKQLSLVGGFIGKHDYLDVTLPATDTRIPSKVIGTSGQHDVAMIKIDVMPSLPKAEINDNYSTIKPGDVVTTLGYPVMSGIKIRKKTLKVVPTVTLSNGNIGKINRDLSRKEETVIVGAGQDDYQLTINHTGEGNSGGPVFDHQGKVIAIFYASNNRMTFAVPIRYGKELMGIGAGVKQ